MSVSDYIKKYFEPTSDGVRVRDIVRESVTSAPVSVSRGIGQGALRGFAAAGTGLYDLGAKILGTVFPSSKQELVRNRPVLTPSTYFQRELYGTDKPITPKAAVDTTKDTAQGVTRTVASVGITAGNVPTQMVNRAIPSLKQPLPFDSSIQTNNNPFSNAVFGGQPVKTLQQSSADVKQFLEPYLEPYIGERGAGLSAYLLVGLGVVLDLSGFGGGKSIKTGVKTFVEGEVPEAFWKFIASTRNKTVLENTFKDIGVKDLSTVDDLVRASIPASTSEEAKIAINTAWTSRVKKLETSTIATQAQAAAERKTKGLAPIVPEKSLATQPIKETQGLTGVPSNNIVAPSLPKSGRDTNLSPSLTRTLSPAGADKSTLYTRPSQLNNLDDVSIYSDYTRRSAFEQANQQVFTDDLARATNLEPDVRIKSKDSFNGKIERYKIEGKNPAEISDVLAGSVTVEPKNISTQIDNIRNNFDVIGITDYFKDPSPFGYKGVNIKVKLPSGALAEIQIHTPESVKIANDIHPIYEKWRNIDLEKLNSKQVLEMHADIVKSKNVVTSAKEAVAKGVERKFITSVKEAFPKLKGKVAGQYIPRSTDDLAIMAKNFIKDDLLGAERKALTETGEDAVAIASELIKKYGDDAARATDPTQANMLYDKAAEIANTLAPKLTEQGRAIQAASILGRMTPEGQVRFAAREIQKFNETAKIKIPELSGEQTKSIVEEMKVISDMPDGIEKAMRFQKLQNTIQDLVPTPLIKKVIAVWKSGLLTGIKTQTLNLFSNLSHATLEVVKDIPAAAVDSVASLFTGQRTKTFTTRGIISGVKEGFAKGLRYLKTGFDERNIGAKLDYKRVNFGKGLVAKAFQTYTDTVFKILGAADQPSYYGALSHSLKDQAFAQGKNAGLKGKELLTFAEEIVSSPTEQMIRYAVADATTAVFQNKTTLGEAAKKIQSIPYVGEIIVPFGRTPSSVAMQIINYSPVGIVKTIIENIGRGKFDQRLFSQGLGRGITGIAILAIGTALAKGGLIALDYPQGDEREQELQKAEGVKNNAIKIGDKWRSPTVLGPAGNILLVGAHFKKALEESGSPTEALSMATLGSAKSFTEQTFLTGIQNAVNAVIDPERYAKSYLPNLIASFVPTIVSDTARATDPLERRPQTITERIQARIPVARRGLEPQVDVLGREKERVGNPLEVLADPTRPSKDTSTFVSKELRRLMDNGKRVSPTVLGDRNGFKALSQEENTRLWKFTGEIVSDKLGSLFSREDYQSKEDDQKEKIVEYIIKQAQINSRAAMAIELTDGLQGEELRAKLSKLKDGELITREVFKKYLELR